MYRRRRKRKVLQSKKQNLEFKRKKRLHFDHHRVQFHHKLLFLLSKSRKRKVFQLHHQHPNQNKNQLSKKKKKSHEKFHNLYVVQKKCLKMFYEDCLKNNNVLFFKNIHTCSHNRFIVYTECALGILKCCY